MFPLIPNQVSYIHVPMNETKAIFHLMTRLCISKNGATMANGDIAAATLWCRHQVLPQRNPSEWVEPN